jgi:hypothetical protein
MNQRSRRIGLRAIPTRPSLIILLDDILAGRYSRSFPAATTTQTTTSHHQDRPKPSHGADRRSVRSVACIGGQRIGHSVQLSALACQLVGQTQVIEGSSGLPYPLPSSARRISGGVVSIRSRRVRLGRNIEIRKKAIPRNARSDHTARVSLLRTSASRPLGLLVPLAVIYGHVMIA